MTFFDTVSLELVFGELVVGAAALLEDVVVGPDAEEEESRLEVDTGCAIDVLLAKWVLIDLLHNSEKRPLDASRSYAGGLMKDHSQT